MLSLETLPFKAILFPQLLQRRPFNRKIPVFALLLPQFIFIVSLWPHSIEGPRVSFLFSRFCIGFSSNCLQNVSFQTLQWFYVSIVWILQHLGPSAQQSSQLFSHFSSDVQCEQEVCVNKTAHFVYAREYNCSFQCTTKEIKGTAEKKEKIDLWRPPYCFLSSSRPTVKRAPYSERGSLWRSCAERVSRKERGR